MTRDNVISEFPESYLNKICYVRTDRNGTREYVDPRCPKCGGEGFIYYYAHVNAGVCFKCGGTGKAPHPERIRVYTPEYKAKVIAKRDQKLREQAVEKNKKTLEKYGFNASGEAYIILGNTYSIKDELKAAGAKYNSFLGWHFSEPQDSYPILKLIAEEILEKDKYGAYIVYEEELSLTVKEHRDNYTTEQRRAQSTSEYVGEIGKRITTPIASWKQLAEWENEYGICYLYKFTTPTGDVLTWKTSKILTDTLDITSITGTVKAHEEFKGEKQTVLTRCKL